MFVIVRLNIREVRIEAAISQTALAKRLGISSAAVSKWEKGKSYPSADRIPDLANALGVPIDQLYGHDPPEKAE